MQFKTTIAVVDLLFALDECQHGLLRSCYARESQTAKQCDTVGCLLRRPLQLLKTGLQTHTEQNLPAEHFHPRSSLSLRPDCDSHNTPTITAMKYFTGLCKVYTNL